MTDAERRRRREVLKYLGNIGVIILVYVLTARFGLSLHPVNSFATFVWPPTGIAIASLWLLGYRFWPGVAVGAFVANFLNGASVPLALGITVGNTLEAVVAVLILQRFVFSHRLRRVKDVLGLVLAAIVGASVSASIGVGSLGLSGGVTTDGGLATWIAWWTGDVLGALTIAPLFFVWSGFTLAPFRWRLAEATGAGLFLLAAAAIVFGNPNLHAPSAAYFIFPPLTWIALRFGSRATVTALFFTEVVAIAGTLQGLGPFISPSVTEQLQLLQLFMGIVSVTFLLMSAAMAERRRAVAKLRQANVELEQKVQERTADLRAKQELLQLLISNAPVILFAFDADGVITLSEGKGLIGLGLRPGQLVGQSVFDLYKGDPGLADVQRALQGEELVGPVRELDGRYIQSHFHPVRNEAGSVVAITGVTIDVTDKELQLQQKIKLEQRERDFVSMASHQLLTPLALIEGYLSMIISGELKGNVKQYLSEAYEGAQRMGRLIQDLLTLSRIESGSLAITSTMFDLTPVVEKICADFRSPAADKRLTLQVMPAASVMVSANPEQVREVLSNLLSNAIKYTDHGEIQVSVTATARAGVVTVKDTGVGIPAEDLPHIFDKFYMSENWVAHQAQSHGLGLYISRLLLTAMRGTISVVSRKGQGSTFAFTLPLAHRSEKTPSH